MRRILLLAVALLQACASAPEVEVGATAPEAEVAVVQPKPQVVQPLPPKPAPEPLRVEKLPRFDGERMEVQDPLKGLPTIDRTVPPDDLWQRIRQGFQMPNLGGSLVKKKTAEYARNPEYLQRIFDRSRLYLYHIVEEIEKRNLPTELALLPMVESAFNPLAYSRARASGLWQFIPGTGRIYKLEQSWWYDERRDIVESTNAALDYLTRLYEMHGDWHLALASYNWGEGAVRRAIEKNRRAKKPTDYASLRMPRETQHYVPKLQAIKNIIADPKPFGIDLDPIPNQPYFEVLDGTPDMDVVLAAKLADMPVEDFVALNPGFSRPLIRATGAARIVLPADKVEVFRANLAKRGDESLVSWQIYHPRRGETLAKIAAKYKIGLPELKRVNGIPAYASRVPKVMVVPLDREAGETAAKLPIQYAAPGAAGRLHTVRRGETLSGIAARYGVSLASLKRLNGGSTFLRIGQKLRIR
ncbi:MAG TPA: transglycosylase SLT domain-containing protein [Burkholderiales bacterium]|nr:transglycosylase SLT domain-containing protein [Burkholderiales bacterium]